MLPNRRQSMGFLEEEIELAEANVGHRGRPKEDGREGGWVDFSDWLETWLDAFGLDAPLYARCIVSILRNTEVAPDEGAMAGGSAAHVWSPRVNNKSQEHQDKSRNLANFWQSGQFERRQRVDSDSGYQSEEEIKSKAIMDCLHCADLEQKQLQLFVTKVLWRYEELTRKSYANESGGVGNAAEASSSLCLQNDSIDSGVCPSPAESHQNYDEAFPPLLEKMSRPNEHHDVDLEEEEPLDEEEDDEHAEAFENVVQLCRSAPFTTEWSVRSAVEFYQQQQQQEHEKQLAKSWEEGKNAAKKQPHFLMPKCHSLSTRGSLKVGSCPTRFEFGFSGGPGLRLSSVECFFGAGGGSAAAVSGPISAPCQQFRYGCTDTVGNSGPNESPSSLNMFDAPKFILHIINDDRKSYPRSPMKMDVEPAMAVWSTAELEDGGSCFEFCLPKTQSSFEEARHKQLSELRTFFELESAAEAKATRLPICSSTHFLPILAANSRETTTEEDSECDTQDSIREELFPRPSEVSYFKCLGPVTPPSRPQHAVEHWSCRPNNELYRPLARRPTELALAGGSELELEPLSHLDVDEEGQTDNMVGCMSPAEMDELGMEENLRDEQERLEKVKPLWPPSRHFSCDSDIWQPTSPIRSAPPQFRRSNEGTLFASEDEEEAVFAPKVSCPNIEMEDEQEDDVLIRYATNISLISQLGVAQ